MQTNTIELRKLSSNFKQNHEEFLFFVIDTGGGKIRRERVLRGWRGSLG